jgi:ABC-type dipeptide/oligopeptide/nickel transport system permease component
MLKFLFQRVVWMGMVLVGVSTLTFLLMHTISGDPWDNYSVNMRAMQNFSITDATKRQLEQRFGLDLPLWQQYTRYMFGDLEPGGAFTCGAICGNLGPSIRMGGRAVEDILFKPPENQTFWESRFGYSSRLALLAFVVAVLGGIPLGLVSAMNARTRLDRGISFGLAVLVSIPNFVLGLLVIIVLASWLKWIKVLPDWSDPRAWLVPTLVLAAIPLASLARVARTSVLDALRGDYVRTARAKGLTRWRTLLFHVLRNALIPIITCLGATLMEIFAGSFIVENLFSFPGFGREYWLSILALDYPMIMGLTLLYAVGIVSANLLIDILYGLIDPRVYIGRHTSDA